MKVWTFAEIFLLDLQSSPQCIFAAEVPIIVMFFFLKKSSATGLRPSGTLLHINGVYNSNRAWKNGIHFINTVDPQILSSFAAIVCSHNLEAVCFAIGSSHDKIIDFTYIHINNRVGHIRRNEMDDLCTCPRAQRLMDETPIICNFDGWGRGYI